ncbi:hypothetical protein OG542_00680 [Streptomyces violaceus]
MIPESFNYAGVTLAIALVPAWLTGSPADAATASSPPTPAPPCWAD